MVLQTIQFFSGTLPSGETITLHTGNERAFDDADATYLLAEYPERFERVKALDGEVVKGSAFDSVLDEILSDIAAEADGVEVTVTLSADKPVADDSPRPKKNKKG